MKIRNRDSAVSVATGYRLDNRGVEIQVQVGARFFSSLSCPGQFWSPPSLLFSVYKGAFSQGVKWPRHEADNPPPSTSKDQEYVDLYIHSPICPYNVVLN